MDKDKQAKLIADFPNAFREIGKSARESCMAFGCEVGDGWEPLVREFARMLEKRGGYFTQVKEKYGTIRMYWAAECGKDDYDIIFGAELMAEALSGYICEQCGNKGTLRPDGWMRTTCDECEAKR